MKHYYHILGLDEGASKEEIKRAYRKMAMRYHPDLNPGTDSRGKFLEVLEAYEYLTGVRKQTSRPSMNPDDLQKFYDLMKKVAEEKAKKQYRQRVREFRKEQERQQSKEVQKGILTLIGLVIVGFAIWMGYDFYKELSINRDPIVVEARVTGFATKRLIYQFPLGDSLVEEQVYASQYGLDIITDNGMPAEVGDRFELTYSQNSPSLHRINYEKVSPGTMRRYMDLVARRLLVIYEDEWSDLSERDLRVRASCMTLLIFKEFGFDGLSAVYYYQANPLANFSHNRWRWSFFNSGEDYLNIQASCRADTMQFGY